MSHREFRDDFEKARLNKVSLPFRDETVMCGPPDCSRARFRRPLLRHCRFDQDDIIFEARLDGGLDGYVWKVRTKAGDPYALKIFWDNRPPASVLYYAAQRECQNAAILQMMQAAVAKAPVRVLKQPVGGEEARENYYAFCDEARSLPCDIPEETRSLSSVPRMVQCYGWMEINPALISLRLRAPPVEVDKLKRSFDVKETYLGIIYELIDNEQDDNEASAVEEVADFLWHASFCFTLSPLAKNWKSGVLVDLSDIIPVRGFGWLEGLYKQRTARGLLVK